MGNAAVKSSTSSGEVAILHRVHPSGVQPARSDRPQTGRVVPANRAGAPVVVPQGVQHSRGPMTGATRRHSRSQGLRGLLTRR